MFCFPLVGNIRIILDFEKIKFSLSLAIYWFHIYSLRKIIDRSAGE